jgi:hypothetical protein
MPSLLSKLYQNKLLDDIYYVIYIIFLKYNINKIYNGLLHEIYKI